MSRGGYEVIIGSRKDRTFGPALMFGMGGTGVELYRDVAVDFPPLNQALARTIISDTKVSQLLRGYRGGTPVDMDALEQALVKVSYLLVDFPEIVEMDVNPLQVRPDGLNALDARLMIEPKDVRKITQPGSHLIISMYPTKYDWEITLDGEKVELRAIRAEDENLWREMIESLSRHDGRVSLLRSGQGDHQVDAGALLPHRLRPRDRHRGDRRQGAQEADARRRAPERSRRPTPKRASSPSWCATATSAAAWAATS